MKIIAIANQKGGVGKTTTAVNLSASIAVSERRTLVIDMDSQCNTSSGYGISYSNTGNNIYHVLIGEKTVHEVVRNEDVRSLAGIPRLFARPLVCCALLMSRLSTFTCNLALLRSIH